MLRNSSGKLFGWLLAVMFTLLTAGEALAQQATVAGRVTDQTGANVPNARVTITNVGTKNVF